jgi:hypothetical protein
MIGTAKPKKIDAAEALATAIEAAQERLDSPYGPQLSAADWALISIAASLREKR